MDNLSEEEKKAIEEIRSFNQYNWEMNNLKTKKFAKPYFDSLDTILNLIEKQSKEIEELTNEVMEKELIIDGMKEDRRIAVEEIQEQYFVSKEESEQIERKAYIKGTNDADELCNKKWRDKIKAKIEERINGYKNMMNKKK